MTEYIKSKYIDNTKIMDNNYPRVNQPIKYKGHKIDPRHKRLTMLDLIDIIARGIRI